MRAKGTPGQRPPPQAQGDGGTCRAPGLPRPGPPGEEQTQVSGAQRTRPSPSHFPGRHPGCRRPGSPSVLLQQQGLRSSVAPSLSSGDGQPWEAQGLPSRHFSLHANEMQIGPQDREGLVPVQWPERGPARTKASESEGTGPSDLARASRTVPASRVGAGVWPGPEPSDRCFPPASTCVVRPRLLSPPRLIGGDTPAVASTRGPWPRRGWALLSPQ